MSCKADCASLHVGECCLAQPFMWVVYHAKIIEFTDIARRQSVQKAEYA